MNNSKMKSRMPSPARSQPATSPRRLRERGNRSMGSPARSKPVRLSTLVQQFKDCHGESFTLSPVNRKSVLSDNTEIEEPRRPSWWKKLDDNSRDVLEVLPSNKPSDNFNDVEDLFEVLSQSQKKIDSSHLPDSSGSDTINSIVLPQRKLFTQKENKPRKTITNVIGPRDTLAKLQKSKVEGQDKTVIASPKKLFGQGPSHRSKPVFPPGLLDISANKTVPNDEPLNTNPKKLFGQHEFQKPKPKYAAAISSASPNKVSDGEPKSAGVKKLFGQTQPRMKPAFPSAVLDISQNTTGQNKTTYNIAPPEVKSQVRNLFGNRPGAKRKNMFVDFIYSESEDEIPEIQPRVFGYPNRRGSSASRGLRDASPTYSVTTDMELDDWKMLPSSTMLVENLEEITGITPIKRPRLTKSDEQKESETGNNSTANKTKESDKSVSSKNKSKTSHNKSKSKYLGQDQVYEKRNSPSLIKNKSNVKNLTQESGEVNTDKEIEIQHITTNKNARKSMNQSIDNDGNIALEYDHDNSVADQFDNKEAEHENIHSNKTNAKDITVHTCENRKLLQELTEVGNKEQPENSQDQNNISKKDGNQSAAKIQAIEKSQKVEKESMEEVEQNYVEPKLNQDEAETSVLLDDEVMVQSVLHDEEDDEIDEDNADGDEHELSNEEQEENKAEEENELSVLQDEEDEEIYEQEPTADKDEVGDETSAVLDEEEGEMEENEPTIDQANESDQENEPENDEDIQDDEDEPSIEQENELSVAQDQGDNSENVQEEAGLPNDDNTDVEESGEEESDEEMALTYEEEDNNESVEASVEQDDEEEHGNEEIDNEEEDNDNQVADASQEEIAQPEETDEIHETPNATMDTTGRNRKKKANETNVRSPEAILHGKTNWNDSFKAQGRNTSFRKTKSLIRPEIRPSMAPVRESVGSTDSSAQGSGWDSHRVTRKTMRQTFGKEFTPRKSLRAMVMEKSAKQQTNANDVHAESMKVPQANSTEIGNEISVPDMEYQDAPENSATDRNDTDDRGAQSDLDTSRRTGKNIHEILQKLKQDSIEQNKQMAEKVRRHYREPDMALLNQYTYLPSDLLMSHAPRKVTKPPKPKTRKPSGVLGTLSGEQLEDLNYKPPKRFAPRNASWVTKRLYKFLEDKLAPKYDYRARVRAEKLVEHIYRFSQDARRLTVAPQGAIDELKQEMARLNIVSTHFEFYQFFHDYMQRELRIKVNPDIVNKLPLPRNGVFSDILQ